MFKHIHVLLAPFVLNTVELENRGKDEEFGDQSTPKHFHNTLKRELLCNYRNGGLMVVLAIGKEKKIQYQS